MNIAYYTSNKTQIDVSVIKEHYLQQEEHHNFFILCEDILSEESINDTACINAYSKTWISGKIIFTNINDYQKHKHRIFANKVLLLQDDEIEATPPAILKEFDEILVQKKDNKIERVTHERL
jgi:hypothetical protein